MPTSLLSIYIHIPSLVVAAANVTSEPRRSDLQRSVVPLVQGLLAFFECRYGDAVRLMQPLFGVETTKDVPSKAKTTKKKGGSKSVEPDTNSQPKQNTTPTLESLFTAPPTVPSPSVFTPTTSLQDSLHRLQSIHQHLVDKPPHVVSIPSHATTDRIAVIGGSSEQREVFAEFYVEMLFINGSYDNLTEALQIINAKLSIRPIPHLHRLKSHILHIFEQRQRQQLFESKAAFDMQTPVKSNL